MTTMRRPPFLDSLRASMTALRRPEDPLDVMPGPCHVVRLAPIASMSDQYARWDTAQAWCRAHIRHADGHTWSRRIDLGPERDQRVPVFSFSDSATAMWFRMRF